MEDKIDISSLMDKATEKVGQVKWVDPRNVIGLPSKDEVLAMESSGGWDESISDALYDYINKWFKYTQSSSYVNDGDPRGAIERYVDSMLYVFVNYHNSVAGLFSLPRELIDVESARKCLKIFKHYLLNEKLTDFEKETIKMYLTDFYQFDDLWVPKEGRFYNEFSDEENRLLLELRESSERVRGQSKNSADIDE